MVSLSLTDTEVDLLRSSVVRSVWTDAEWLEDIIEDENGTVLASASTPMMSRVLRKMVLAVQQR